MSGAGAGAENGAERARKWDDWERDLKKYGGVGASRSGNRAVSGLNRPLTMRSNLKMTDFATVVIRRQNERTMTHHNKETKR